MSDEDQARFQRLLVRSNRRWLEILDQPKPPTDDQELLAIWEELRSILAKYVPGNDNAALNQPKYEIDSTPVGT